MTMQRSMENRDCAFLGQLAFMAREAGKMIMEARAGGVSVEYKEDKSPVTVADETANHYIVEQLERLFPHVPIVSEEGAKEDEHASAEYFWLVDPLDGTKSFIRGDDDFTVNIGLIKNRAPVAGVIFVPAQNVMYIGSDQAGAFRTDAGGEEASIRVNAPRDNKRAVIMSKHHASPDLDEYIAPYEVTGKVQAASSLKFCRVAEGVADLYPRTGPTMEWDTAAGHAILLAAGGKMTMLDGSPFLYGKPEYRNPGFIAGV